MAVQGESLRADATLALADVSGFLDHLNTLAIADASTLLVDDVALVSEVLAKSAASLSVIIGFNFTSMGEVYYAAGIIEAVSKIIREIRAEFSHNPVTIPVSYPTPPPRGGDRYGEAKTDLTCECPYQVGRIPTSDAP